MSCDRFLLIINPISGTGNKAGLPDLVRKRIKQLGYELDVHFTTGPGNATEIASDAASNGYKAVIAAGGDGTINECAKALCSTDTILGIIPSGSGNGLARHLNISVDPSEALKIIAEGNVLNCDYGAVNNHPFFCTFGVGFDAIVSEAFAKQKRRGILSYLRSALQEYTSYNPEVYTIEANGQTLTQKAFIVAVCNASQYGNNAYIAPKASITDGLLDVTIIHAGTPITTARAGVDILTGYIDRNTMINTFRTDAAKINRTSCGPAHIDGEPITLGSELDIRCHHHQLRVFAPNESQVKPIITPMYSAMQELRFGLERLLQSIKL